MKGNCLCGSVEFEYAPLLGVMGNCHCEECRKSSGASFVTSIFIVPSSHKIILLGKGKRVYWERIRRIIIG